MKKLNFGTIADGLNTLQNTLEQNSGIGWSEMPSTLPKRTPMLRMIRMKQYGNWPNRLRLLGF